MIRAAAVLLLVQAAAAQEDPTFPATDCAALWAATADFRATYAIDDASPAEALDQTAAFRAAALDLGAVPGALDARIATLRPVYVTLLQRYILDGDRDSRDQYDWLSGICAAFAAERGLPGH